MSNDLDVTEGALPDGLPYLRLGSVTAPTLVVGGERDNVYGQELLRATAEGVRDGRLILNTGASHASTMTHKRLAEDIATFLSSPS